MSIIKNTPHFLNHSGLAFTTLINKTLDLIKDPGTLGIYVYLASKPHQWEISKKNIQNRFNKGRDYVDKRFMELRSLGLLDTKAIKNEKGIIVRWETTLYNEPQITENPYSGDKKDTESTLLKIHHLEKPQHINKRDKEIKENNISIVREPKKVIENTYVESTFDTSYPDSKSEPECILSDAQEGFKIFWDIYPVKKGKKDCEKIWAKKKLESKTKEIITKLQLQILKEKTFLDGYVPNPSTYLNQERWLDAITEKKNPVYKNGSKNWAEGIKNDIF